MNTETTTCISYQHYDVIKNIAQYYKLSVTTLIILLIRYAAEYKKVNLYAGQKVAYRERRGEKTWRLLHLQPKADEYEFLLDVKKVWKMSVARVIEFCIENYLFELITNVLEKDKTDNYLYSNYHFEVGEEEGITYYLIYWGLPKKILQKLLKIPLQLPT